MASLVANVVTLCMTGCVATDGAIESIKKALGKPDTAQFKHVEIEMAVGNNATGQAQEDEHDCIRLQNGDSPLSNADVCVIINKIVDKFTNNNFLSNELRVMLVTPADINLDGVAGNVSAGSIPIGILALKAFQRLMKRLGELHSNNISNPLVGISVVLLNGQQTNRNDSAHNIGSELVKAMNKNVAVTRAYVLHSDESNKEFLFKSISYLAYITATVLDAGRAIDMGGINTNDIAFSTLLCRSLRVPSERIGNLIKKGAYKKQFEKLRTHRKPSAGVVVGIKYDVISEEVGNSVKEAVATGRPDLYSLLALMPTESMDIGQSIDKYIEKCAQNVCDNVNDSLRNAVQKSVCAMVESDMDIHSIANVLAEDIKRNGDRMPINVRLQSENTEIVLPEIKFTKLLDILMSDNIEKDERKELKYRLNTIKAKLQLTDAKSYTSIIAEHCRKCVRDILCEYSKCMTCRSDKLETATAPGIEISNDDSRFPDQCMEDAYIGLGSRDGVVWDEEQISNKAIQECTNDDGDYSRLIKSLCSKLDERCCELAKETGKTFMDEFQKRAATLGKTVGLMLEEQTSGTSADGNLLTAILSSKSEYYVAAAAATNMDQLPGNIVWLEQPIDNAPDELIEILTYKSMMDNLYCMK